MNLCIRENIFMTNAYHIIIFLIRFQRFCKISQKDSTVQWAAISQLEGPEKHTASLRHNRLDTHVVK